MIIVDDYDGSVIDELLAWTHTHKSLFTSYFLF